jgi:hypothetical protein
MEEAAALSAVLVDSDVVIEVLRRRDTEITTRWKLLGHSEARVYCSPVTVAEIWHGAKGSEHERVEALFAQLTCLPADGRIGRRAGSYLALYQKSHGLQMGDALIAATASVHGVPLWTRNRKHYPMRDVRLV